ncbi:MAG: hypothetical protein ACLP9C_00440 [Acidimicrobiales bacterium]
MAQEGDDKIVEVGGRSFWLQHVPATLGGMASAHIQEMYSVHDLAEDVFVGAVRSVYSTVMFSSFWDISLGSTQNWAEQFLASLDEALASLVGAFDDARAQGAWPPP